MLTTVSVTSLRRFKVEHYVALVTLLVFAAASGSAATIGHVTHRHRHHSHVHELTVTPSEAIEERVQSEIARGESLLARPAARNLFDSPYVVSAIVYHDGFLKRFPMDKANADPSRRIIAHLTTLVTPDVRQEYIDLLRRLDPDAERSTTFVEPVNGFLDVRHLRRNHHDAIDLFAPEGSAVHAASSGVVILADRGWEHGDPFAVSSLRGGNSVVVFDPAESRFYRYCHLALVLVEPGALVHAGQMIATVGHTGANAERTGHGQHLHFEINQYDGQKVRALDYHALLALLRSASPPPAENVPGILTAEPYLLSSVF